jgi:HTH-type transcriptional regulator / antitoxin HigA
MALVTKTKRLPPSYFALVEQFPLIHIRDDAKLDAASAMIDKLLQQDLDRGSQEYLDALTDLVATYEDERVVIPDACEADVLRELMRSNSLTQPQLAKQVGIAQSTLSSVLTGARPLTKDHVIKLAKFFNIAPTAFLPR